MRFLLRLGFVFIYILVNSTLFSQSISIGKGENVEQLTEVSKEGFTLNLQVNSLQLLRVKHKQEVYYSAIIPSFGKSLEIGNPQLPVYKKLIELPEGASYRVEVLKMHFVIYDLEDYNISNYLFPTQASVEKREHAKLQFSFNKQVYSNDAFFSTPLYSIDELGEMRGVHIGRLNISPVEYNPVKNQLKIYDELEIRVIFDEPKMIGVNEQGKASKSMAFNTVGQSLLNAKAYATPTTVGVQYPLKYVIVADSSFRTALIPFIKWKEKQGYKIIEAYTSDSAVGNSYASIKAYLNGLYLAGTALDPAPSFVLFVGDVGQIPKYPGMFNSWAADLYYCEFTNDYFPEMMYGRFSANDTSQLNPQIEKTIEYEKYLMPNPSYLDTSILISGKDASFAPVYGDGQINYGTSNYFNAANGVMCKSYRYIDQSYNKDLEIRQNADTGAALINYTAHGFPDGWQDPRFKIGDVANMTNKDKYPIMIGNACLTNKFDAPVCFGEALLRARDKGAIAYIGASDNTLWDEDYYWAVGFGNISTNPSYSNTTSGLYDLIFHTHGEPHHQQALNAYQYIQAGNLAVTQGGSNVRRYWELYHLMGDPSLMPYLKVPSPISASYNPLLPLGAPTFDVSTEPYALVAISRNDSLISSGIADSTGQITLYFTPLTVAGTVDVVITASQKQPYFGTTVAAQPTGPYVVYYQNSIIDSSGNNNGLADYGEHIQLDLSMINITGFSADSSYARLLTQDNMISLSDSIRFIGDIAANDTLNFDTLFAFDVAMKAIDGHQVKFQLMVEDSTGANWTSSFYIPLHAPNIVIGKMRVDDSQYGNGNGRIDPGETVSLKVELTNDGSISATNLQTSLSTNYGGISISNNSFFIDSLKSDSIKYAVFEATVDNSFSVGDVVKFDFSINSIRGQKTEQFTLLVGQVIEDFESGDFSKFIWRSTNANNWQIENTIVYEGQYSSRSHPIADSDTSALFISLNVLQDDSISFYHRLYSEESYDLLRFSIDGKTMGYWSGIRPWTFSKFPLSKGLHTLKWAYIKDNGYADTNYDAAFLDNIVFPPTDVWTNVENANEQLNSFSLSPNPATDYSMLSFDLQIEANVNILLYDSKGQIVRELKRGMQINKGLQQIKIETQGLSSGIYFIEIQNSNQRWVKRLVVL